MVLWSRHAARFGFVVLLLGSDDLAPAHPANQSPAIAPATFEDIYGPSGATFQGAVGFRVYQATTATGPAQAGFGAAIDDMVVQWREFKLVEDATNCGTSGSCATLEADSATVFESNGSIGITVFDASPYAQSTPVNDCNQDGDFSDAGIDDQDCDDNGTPDVLARATSPREPAGELVVLDRIGASDTYRGTLAISNVADGEGVLYFVPDTTVWFTFVNEIAVHVPFLPSSAEITIHYDDRWDGSASGSPCRASADPAVWGSVIATVKLPIVGIPLQAVTYRVSDAPGSGSPGLPAGQDGDGFPDTNETVDVFVTVRNPTSATLTNVTAQLVTTDPKVDCILRGTVTLASLPPFSIVELPSPFRFKVAASADRSGVVPPVACNAGACGNGAGACTTAATCKKTTNDSYAAAFSVLLSSEQSVGLSLTSGALRVELDLNVNAPVKATSTYTEGFESGFSNMTLMNLDDSIASNTLSNGWRCQYNDPDFVGGQSYGETECYLGFTLGQPILNDWHVHDTSGADGGRAYAGFRSMHYGIHTQGNPGLDTFGFSQMDAIRVKSSLNFAPRVCRADPSSNQRACNTAADCVGFGGGPCVSANPELSFKHQVSLVDDRSNNTPSGQATDRGVVQAQIVAGGALWEKLMPYQNVYDDLGTDNYSNCMFDPVDDGNTEDDYFDPTDPHRRLGPSSTCFPAWVFNFLGDTDAPFDARNLAAAEGPGLQGSLGIGTWVESKFDLSRFRGRAIRIRWLVTTLKVSDTASWQDLLHWNPTGWDDGWYVDDVRVTQTLGTSATTVTLDTVDRSALPACGSACTTVTAALGATPPVIPSPGSVVVLSSYGSMADRCIGGALLSEYWIDGDANGVLGDPADIRLRPPTVDPLFDEVPLVTTRYAVRVFCSSAPACADTEFVTVTVQCPGSPGVFNPEAWWTRLRFTDATTLAVPAAGQSLDAARGDLLALRATGSFGGEVCLADGTAATTLTDAATPVLGGGYYYLVRGADFACNENRSWRTFSARENPTDPTRRDTQVVVCAP